MKQSMVGLYKTENCIYPRKAPFRPSIKYPEISNEDISDESNEIYEAVREAFHIMGYDVENYGAQNWNPLGEFVKEGDTVLLKPNMVHNNNPTGLGEQCLYTQPSVVAAIIDYCIIALNGTGRIIVGDAPVQSCDFERLIRESGYQDMVQYYIDRGINIDLLDFRIKDHDDSADGIIVNLDELSCFSGKESANQEYRVTCYNPQYMKENHHGSTHRYKIHREVLNADVIINIPKPKCHRKAGLTASMKNLIGVNCNKEFLPHHTVGSVKQGGDEYLISNAAKMLRSKILDKRNQAIDEKKTAKAAALKVFDKLTSALSKIGNDGFYEGSWYGNHTICKTIADINLIVENADKEGVIKDEAQRKMLVVADMVICGEKEGPLSPSPKEVGIIGVSDDMYAFDEAVCLLMGFDPKKVPTFDEAKELIKCEEWYIASNSEALNGKKYSDLEQSLLYRFEPSSGWKGHIELL